MSGRTPFQETLLGDDAGSRMAWTLWRQGYERGVQTGHDVGYAAGYAEGVDALREAAELLASYEPSLGVSHDELRRRRSEPRGNDHDQRTGVQIVADAHASWATLDRTDAAA